MPGSRPGRYRRSRWNAPGNDSNTNWSPDGKRIALTSSRDPGNFEIHTMTASGTRETNRSNRPAEDCFPAWSPDGKRIVFLRNDDAIPAEILTMAASGKRQRRLTVDGVGAVDTTPDWQPRRRR